MTILAKNEAQRLFLHHLLSVFFHENAKEFFVEAKRSGENALIFLSRNGQTSSGNAPLNLSVHREEKRAENAAFGLAFFRAAVAFTDYVPPYGTLIGVRPVKVPLFYENSGFSREKVLSVLKEEFLVSPEKAELLAELSKLEKHFAAQWDRKEAMLYVSIPFCPSRCSYCSFISSSAPVHLSLIPDYLTLLKEEIRQTAAFLRKKKRTIKAVYIGGGTPGILTAEQIRDLILSIRGEFEMSAVKEFSVEIGRPDTVTDEKLSVMRSLGVDRISINPQTTNDATLLRIGRNHTANDFFDAMRLAKKYDFPCINCDLIAGLSGETPTHFLHSLQEVLSFDPENITIHALCRKKSASDRASDEVREPFQEAIANAHRICIERHYKPYYLYRQKEAVSDLENLGLAKKGKIGIYNLAMMEDLCDIFSCGSGGIGKILPRKEGGKIRRFAAYKYPYESLADPDRITRNLAEMNDLI